MKAILEPASRPLPSTLAEVQNVARVSQIKVILDVCCRITGMGFSAVARVTEDEWMTCASLDQVGFGLNPGDTLPLKSTICDEIRDSRVRVVFDDAFCDEKFRDHEAPRAYGLRSYISVPIILSNGQFFGTLCAIDSHPRPVNRPEIINTFELFAQLIANELAAQKETEALASDLAFERRTGRLREEFIAVVGHDLRNPIAALSAGLRLLDSRPDMRAEIMREMRGSLFRMTGITANLMDLARGRLGGGIAAARVPDVDVEALVSDIVQETRSYSERDIDLQSDLQGMIACDPIRIGQLVGNLLGNAVTHGEAGTPIKVEAHSDGTQLTIRVTNRAQTIPPAVLETMFQPFERGGGLQNGLGLGLYISSEIARAHGGTLAAESRDNHVTFRFEMPLTSL